MTNEDFHGAWRLVSATAERSDGKVIHPYGQNPKGSLIYAPGNRMNAIIDGDRTVAYFGTFEVNSDDRTITHQVEASLSNNWEGEPQVRHYEVNGNRLTLRTPPIARPKGDLEFVLVWER